MSAQVPCRLSTTRLVAESQTFSSCLWRNRLSVLTSHQVAKISVLFLLPLFADMLYERELAIRPECFKGEDPHF
jgi:hypothetical protein